MSTIFEKVLSEAEQAALRTEKLLRECEQILEQAEYKRQRVESKKVSDSVNSENSGSAVAGGKRNKNRAANMAAVQLLMDAYPEVFSRDKVRPLKIGIQEDLVADDKVSRTKIKRALASYVRSPQYLRSFQEGAERIGLDGQPAGTVTAEEAGHAKGKLQAMQDARRERIKEQAREAKQKEKEERLSSKLDQLLTLNNRN
ncbi:ProQ/FINO family protein [Nitrincola iocasae]|uniref:DNA competence protein n=1 Tax=Nitrincola iocasae TaxID=2614693 RepID=A0A5J6LEB1_9GAMM|nr:ProQ/FinO family protein [Nitrincola iocasae]QEW07029.1 DNA competence protein [Nitrincola iocasae]